MEDMATVDSPQPLQMAIERYFQVALYLLVLTGFATLASTGGVDLPTLVLAGARFCFADTAWRHGVSRCSPNAGPRS
jgi:hypothetical protein